MQAEWDEMFGVWAKVAEETGKVKEARKTTRSKQRKEHFFHQENNKATKSDRKIEDDFSRRESEQGFRARESIVGRSTNIV